MSEVRQAGICYCDCHTPRGRAVRMMHSVPCCEGRCPVCSKFYKRGNDHVEKCRERVRLLAAEIED